MWFAGGDLVLFMYIYFKAEETRARFSVGMEGARETERTMHWSGVMNFDAEHQVPEEVGGCHLQAVDWGLALGLRRKPLCLQEERKRGWWWQWEGKVFLRRFYFLCGNKWSEALVAHSCLTLCDPMDCSPPGSSVLGIFQARILEWVAISFSRGSSRPRDQTQVSSTAGRFFTDWTMCTAETLVLWTMTVTTA